MAAPKFKVEYLDGSADSIALLPKAQLAYERETKRSLRDDIASITHLYELAWYAAGKPDGSLDSWVDRVESIVAEDEESENESNPPTSTAESLG